MKKATHHPYKIPSKINLAILVVCSVLYFVLLYASSHCSTGWIFIYGFLFAIVMIPVYSLIHEAEHNILRSKCVVEQFFRKMALLFIHRFVFIFQALSLAASQKKQDRH